ncbi:MAG: hypothetical protein HOV68_11585 [Streptomycetaceae bacterium]|nr:hypothetical protein [Streptomycetaceae bacterium]
MSSAEPPLPEQSVGVLDWVPTYGHALHKVGQMFDVVRIDGAYGDAVAARLLATAAPETGPGPVVVDRSRRHAVYFFLAPGAGAGYDWPPGAACLRQRNADVFVGVTALEGETWPLTWLAPPTRSHPFVDPGALYACLGGASERPFG